MKTRNNRQLLLAATMLLLAVLTSSTARAQDLWGQDNDPIYNTTYTATSGTAGASGENYGNLVDGNKNTKWCVVAHNFNNGNNNIYIEFQSSTAFVPTGYVITTGTDSQNILAVTLRIGLSMES